MSPLRRGTCWGSREHPSRQPRGLHVPILESRGALGREGQLAGTGSANVPSGPGTYLASHREKRIAIHREPSAVRNSCGMAGATVRIR